MNLCVPQPNDSWVTRRTAPVGGLGLAAGAVSGSFFGRVLQPARIARGAGEPIHPVNGRWLDVAALTELVEGQGQRVAAGAVGAYLFRHGNTVAGVSSICSHLPCELQWDAAKDLLACPCHPATFESDGHSTDLYSRLPPLSSVVVRVTVSGRVEVLGTA